MAEILRVGVHARIRAEKGTLPTGKRLELLPRSKWLRRRGLREIWENQRWGRRCFSAWRTFFYRGTRGVSANLRVAATGRVTVRLAASANATNTVEQALNLWLLRAAFHRVKVALSEEGGSEGRGVALHGFVRRGEQPEARQRTPRALAYLRWAYSSAEEVAARQRREREAEEAALAKIRAYRAHVRAGRALAVAANKRRRGEEQAHRREEAKEAWVQRAVARGRQSGNGLFQAMYRTAVGVADGEAPSNYGQRGIDAKATQCAIGRLQVMSQLAQSSEYRIEAVGRGGRRRLFKRVSKLARPPIAWKPRAQSYHPGEEQAWRRSYLANVVPGGGFTGRDRAGFTTVLQRLLARIAHEQTREGRHPRRRAVERAVARVVAAARARRDGRRGRDGAAGGEADVATRNDDDILRCPAGHAMRQTWVTGRYQATDDGVSCIVCDAPGCQRGGGIRVGDKVYTCTDPNCEFDMCVPCAETSAAHARGRGGDRARRRKRKRGEDANAAGSRNAEGDRQHSETAAERGERMRRRRRESTD